VNDITHPATTNPSANTTGISRIEGIRAFRDNYIWALIAGPHVAVVDPGEAAPVLEFLRREKLELAAILLTHHHADHVGGVPELLEHFKVPVYGPRTENIATVAHPLGEGDEISLPKIDAHFRVLDIPGHTRGHIAYYGANSVFCGDTLFACGCGRLFEGTPAQMSASLAKLAALPNATLVYCGHEYTLANILFAAAVEPGNAALKNLESEARAKRAQDLPTLPSTIGAEKATNPFLRASVPQVATAAEAHAGHALKNPVEVFAVLREWKNKF
jgi:hydroxyacylglutathione hydrolase